MLHECKSHWGGTPHPNINCALGLDRMVSVQADVTHRGIVKQCFVSSAQ